ncbi:hypothetical protein Patl1_30910 [Pistacia atlantica]|uniref:Uncharacterized protein n=1 Tax=Pistacia atlantica TaxID=434234 RepID=A0ACC1AD20_9ROSI|nr:hypothetical protein Patl1_30910 [Pistacia atlantica]
MLSRAYRGKLFLSHQVCFLNLCLVSEHKARELFLLLCCLLISLLKETQKKLLLVLCYITWIEKILALEVEINCCWVNFCLSNMGRKLQREHSGLQFESYHPGCLWSILHILDNHQWSNVKRIIPNKKHRRGRKAICFGNPKTISLERESGEVQNFLDADNFIVEQDTTTNSIEKHSGIASIKALISEEMSKEENHKQLILGFPAQSKLQRTYSIHHLDPSDFRPGKISDDWTNPIIVLHKDEKTSSTRSRVSSLKKRTRKLNCKK